MALKSDIHQAEDNRPIDLQERDVKHPEPVMSSAVLDLRKGKKQATDNQDFFFEFLPMGTLSAPPVQLNELRHALAKAYDRTKNYIRQHPRYFIIGLLVLAAILLYTLSSITHRTVIRSNPDTLSVPATSVKETSTPPASSAASADTPSQGSAGTAGPGVGGSTGNGIQGGNTNTDSTPPAASVSDPKLCVAGSTCLELTSPLLEPVNPLIPSQDIKL